QPRDRGGTGGDDRLERRFPDRRALVAQVDDALLDRIRLLDGAGSGHEEGKQQPGRHDGISSGKPAGSPDSRARTSSMTPAPSGRRVTTSTAALSPGRAFATATDRPHRFRKS